VDKGNNHKHFGAYYTPSEVVHTLVSWATRGSNSVSALDPACGDGRFLERIDDATGVDIDTTAVADAAKRCPHASIINADFFEWALQSERRFDAVVGNPPFIRYQRFSGLVRQRALQIAAHQGVKLSGLASSWAPFVIGGASLLKQGGRLAFVIPAEIAYANYARPVLRFLLESFGHVEIKAVREKLFPKLNEDCWLVLADEYGGHAESLHLATAQRFHGVNTAWNVETIPAHHAHAKRFRLREYLLPPSIREYYHAIRQCDGVHSLGDLTRLGIGYVTGANDFFHLRPSEARRTRIPERFLRPAVRSNRALSVSSITRRVVSRWVAEDRPFLLLDTSESKTLPRSVQKHLDSPEGALAKTSYKCRNRTPWYRVPDVRVPHAFLSIMSTRGPRLVGNSAKCVCTNSVHAVTVSNGTSVSRLLRAWAHPLTELSCEVEGHQLGGGLLKVEPCEARRILVSLDPDTPRINIPLLEDGIRIMREWRTTNVSREV